MELKPCPFCKSTNVKLITSVKDGKRQFDRVRCQLCGATGPWFDGHPNDAVEGWNNSDVPEPFTCLKCLRKHVNMSMK